MKDYTNISELFNNLNKADCEYLILRNYNNLLEDDIYMAGHGDVDMLCSDVHKAVKAMGAESCNPKKGELGDKTHFYVKYKGQRVSIDIRSVGDGYYCTEWEKAMLRTRKSHECFYVMNEENHFYSLIYHAIFQKPALSTEYRERLSMMSGSGSHTEDQFIDLLEKYMQEHNYHYVFAHDFHVPLRQCMHDKSLCQYTWKEQWPHFKFESRNNIIALLVRVKHKIFGTPKV